MSTPTEIENAIHAGIVRASGLDASRVIWRYQDADQPALDYVALSLSGDIGVGIDGMATSYDAGRPLNSEIAIDVVGVREVTLTVEAYTARTVSPPTGDQVNARALVGRIRSALALPGVISTFGAAGVSAFDPGPVQYVPPVVAVGFRGRAVMDVRCYVPADAARELCGYIARAEGTAEIAGTHDGVTIEEPIAIALA